MFHLSYWVLEKLPQFILHLLSLSRGECRDTGECMALPTVYKLRKSVIFNKVASLAYYYPLTLSNQSIEPSRQFVVWYSAKNVCAS